MREFAGEAARDGVRVLYGACDAVVRTPYGPFVEALDQLARSLDPAELRAALGPGAGELSRLLPDLGARVGDLPPAVKADPDTERHRLHSAVTDLLAGATATRPALLVLEDGHWADAPTLLLLRHLARAGTMRVMVLATFRDTEADVPESLSETLADLRRYDVVRLRLGGLSDADVAEFVRRAGGGELGEEPRALARAIHDLTEGNAFLVCELWRALVETGTVELAGGTIRVTRPPAELGSPESVREVVSQRLARLAPRTTDLLELAATAGAEFELDVVRRAAGLGESELLAALDEGVRSGMIEALPSQGLACRFTHELVRRALYDRLSGPRRAELHLRVGEALEASGARSGRTLADLAHHFAAAAPFGPAERAVEYNLLAARAAVQALALDEAASRLRTALAIGIDDPGERAGAYLELGEAAHRAGKADDALEAFTTAAVIARELGDARLLARAAIGHEDACWRPGVADRGAVELLEEAAAALGEEDSELRVGLLSGLARALDFQGRRERGAIVRTSAIEMARRLDDRPGLATVLMRAYWSRGTTPLEEIMAMVTEGKAIGEELGDTEKMVEAMAWRLPALVALGDLDAARHETAALVAAAERTAQPFMLHVAEHYASAIALCDGRLDAAEAAARRSHEWGSVLTGRDSSGVYGIQMFSLRREQGRLAELAPVVRLLAGDPARTGPWRPGLVALLAELGMEADAARELARTMQDGLDPYRESLWLGSLAYLTDACTALGDAGAAAHAVPRARAVRRRHDDDRPPRRLLRRRRPLPRHARRRRSATPTAPSCTSSARWRSTAAWAPRPGSRTPRTSTRGCCSCTARASATGPPRSWARRRRWPSASGCPRCCPASARSARPRPCCGCPTASRRARCRSWASSPAASATARSAARCRSASTPPPTTCAASCARPAARTGPRPPRTPTVTGSQLTDHVTIGGSCRFT